jgi:hypothetical protein
MRIFPQFAGSIRPWVYALLAPALVLSQNAFVAACYHLAGAKLVPDVGFWLLPLRRLSQMPRLSSLEAAGAFAFALAISWALAVVSFRRAEWSRQGHAIAGFAIVPVLQLPALLLLLFMPRRRTEPSAEPVDPDVRLGDVLQGILAGVAIIVLAVLISAVTFGAYGWGLFVLTPFLVGFTTAYIVNRRVPISVASTLTNVLAAGALGGLALLMVALEGFVCIVLVAPLGLAFAALGGLFGRAVAQVGHRIGGSGGQPLMSVAILPALFALEGSMPPAIIIQTSQQVDIAASPEQVWQVITADEPNNLPPGLTGIAGLAYPVRARLLGSGVGATRLGIFSTGIAKERVTEWVPNQRLAFAVMSQPPAMEEMSPYRKVHAPHVSGYFVTGDTSFSLTSLSNGKTRLKIEAAHMLRIDPVLYWEPIARWAIRVNVQRVLEDAKLKAERQASAQL